MENTLTDPPPTLFERWNYMILPFCGSYAFGSKSPERKDLYIQNHHGQRIPQQKDALNNFGSLFVKFTPSRPRFAPKSLIRVYKRWQGWLWRGSGVWAIKWQLLSGFRVELHARAPCPGLWLTFPYLHLWNVYFQDKDTMGSYDKYIEFN